jgi:Phage Single-stranded DNA-binding protein
MLFAERKGIMSHDQTGNELVSQKAMGLAIGTIGGIPGLCTSLDCSKEAGRLKLLHSWQSPDFQSGDCVNTVIGVSDYVIAPVEVANPDTGELEMITRTILISEDGTSYAFGSKGIISSMQMLVMVFGSPPWVPEKKLKVAQVTTRSGRRTFNLQPAEQ